MHEPDTCCICSQIAGRERNDLISRLLSWPTYVRRVPRETHNFAAVPSLGPLAPGHTLLCPKSHIRSIAWVPMSYQEEYDAFRDSLAGILVTLFGAPVHAFEHGSPQQAGRILCSVDHAHLHLVPADIDVLATLTREANWTEIGPSLGSLREVVGEKEYLFYESPEHRRIVAVSGECGFESQYLRRVFATALGSGAEWNWRDDPRPIDADNTYRAILAAPC